MAMAIFGLSLGQATKSSDPLAELFFRQSWQSFQPFQFTGNIDTFDTVVLPFQDYKHQISHGSWV
jgi:hypothetical protein